MITAATDSFFFDKCKTSGKGPDGQAEKAALKAHHYFQQTQETDNRKKEIRDAEFLTSRLADREIQEAEELFVDSKRYTAVKTFVSGGAYVSLLEAPLEGKKSHLLVCRGTAMRSTATGGYLSGLNDLQMEIGSMGVDAVFSDLSSYLRSKNISKIALFGKSLGGAHAQKLALLLETKAGVKVKKLITVCSVGISDEVHALFKAHIATRSKPFVIDVIRNGGQSIDSVDHIPLVGGAHLGHKIDPAKCRVSVFYIDNEHTIKTISETPNYDVYYFGRSFSQAHLRQTTLRDFFYRQVNQTNVDTHLAMGRRIEWYRQFIAWPVSYFC